MEEKEKNKDKDPMWREKYATVELIKALLEAKSLKEIDFNSYFKYGAMLNLTVDINGESFSPLFFILNRFKLNEIEKLLDKLDVNYNLKYRETKDCIYYPADCCSLKDGDEKGSRELKEYLFIFMLNHKLNLNGSVVGIKKEDGKIEERNFLSNAFYSTEKEETFYYVGKMLTKVGFNFDFKLNNLYFYTHVIEKFPDAYLIFEFFDTGKCKYDKDYLINKLLEKTDLSDDEIYEKYVNYAKFFKNNNVDLAEKFYKKEVDGLKIETSALGMLFYNIRTADKVIEFMTYDAEGFKDNLNKTAMVYSLVKKEKEAFEEKIKEASKVSLNSLWKFSKEEGDKVIYKITLENLIY